MDPYTSNFLAARCAFLPSSQSVYVEEVLIVVCRTPHHCQRLRRTSFCVGLPQCTRSRHVEGVEAQLHFRRVRKFAKSDC